MAKYSKGAQKGVESAMKRMEKGTLRSGRSGKKVSNPKQAIAIGLSEAREKGAKVPAKKSAPKKSPAKRSTGQASAPKKSAAKKSSASRSFPKRPAPKKSPVKKATSNKTVAKKNSSTTKVPVKKSAPKKSPSKKAVTKKIIAGTSTSPMQRVTRKPLRASSKQNKLNKSSQPDRKIKEVEISNMLTEPTTGSGSAGILKDERLPPVEEQSPAISDDKAV